MIYSNRLSQDQKTSRKTKHARTHRAAPHHAVGPAPKKTTKSQKKQRLIPAAIFLAALIIRLIYLLDSADAPTFNQPIIDSVTYHELAQRLVEQGALRSDLFWQQLFYPLFVALVYVLTDSSMIAVKLVQLLLGSFTCLLTYAVAKKVFDRPTAVIAGLITAFYGPLIFFDAELLATGWAAFWAILLIWLFLRAAERMSLRLVFALGLCGALATITRTTFLPFFLAAAVWLIFRLARHARRRAATAALTIMLAFACITVPVAGLSKRLTGRFTIVPFGASLNLYLGNNPDYCETLTIRPGWKWDRIIAMPALQHVENDFWAKSQFFTDLAYRYALEQPVSFAKGILRKTAQFLNSREIPRNLDIYLFRKWSLTLRPLVWKLGGFGFPLGVLLPLSLLGLIYYWRKVPLPIVLFVMLYPLSIILVFVTGRYRVPIVPVMAVLAGAGCLAFARIIRARRWKHLVAAAFGFTGTQLPRRALLLPRIPW